MYNCFETFAIKSFVFTIWPLNGIKSDEDKGNFLLENANVRDILNMAGWVKNISVANKGYAAMNLLIHEVLSKFIYLLLFF